MAERTHPPEERTPAAWAREALAIARRVHPAYSRNSAVRLPAVELIRPLDSGLLVSQSFLRIRETYHLCFALLFSPRRWPVLYPPLMSGARLDHNRTVGRQLLDDLGLHPTHADEARRPPPGVWSSGAWRANTLEQLERGLQVPEELLLPRHLGLLRHGAPRLVRFFSRAEVLVPALLEARARSAGREPSAGSRELITRRFPHVPRPLSAGWLDLARTLDALEGLGTDPAGVMDVRGKSLTAGDVAQGATETVGDDALIADALDTFAGELDRLAELTAIARRLGGGA